MDQQEDPSILKQAGLSNLDLDDRTLPSIITVQPRIKRQGSFPLMDLPVEIRNVVYGFVLPDFEEVKAMATSKRCSVINSTEKSFGAKFGFSTNDRNRRTTIMRSSLVVYLDIRKYLYHRACTNSFRKMSLEIDVNSDGFGVHMKIACSGPRRRWSAPCCSSGPFPGDSTVFLIPELPLSIVCKVTINIQIGQTRPRPYGVQQKLIDVCQRLQGYNALQQLHVKLVDGSFKGSDGSAKLPLPSWISDANDVDWPLQEPSEWVWDMDLSVNGGAKARAKDIAWLLQSIKLLRNVRNAQIVLSPVMEQNSGIVKHAEKCVRALTRKMHVDEAYHERTKKTLEELRHRIRRDHDYRQKNCDGCIKDRLAGEWGGWRNNCCIHNQQKSTWAPADYAWDGRGQRVWDGVI